MQMAADTTARWQVGLARHDITAFELGRTGVGGWGMPRLRLRGVAEPIHARALVLRGGGLAIVMVAVELCFVSAALRSAVLAELARVAPERGFVDEAVMICATHSHGGPDGTSPQLLYAATNGGISAWVFDAVVDGVVAAILEADERAEPGRLRVAAVEIPASEPVAFNRSLSAFARNLDAPRSANRDPVLATHRRSTCLRIEDLEGRVLGLVNWFGVHGTSVHPGLERVHADNKGLAAAEVERAVIRTGEGRPEFVALFVQEAAGDVSPNPSADARRGLASTGANAAIQARHALAGLRAAETAPALACATTARLRHLDMGHAPGPDQLVLGWSMVAGTDDGPGPLYAFRSLVDGVSRAVEAVRGEPKLPFLHLRGGVDQGRFFGVVPLRAALRLFAPIDPASAFVLEVDAAGLADRSLAPEVVPVQHLGLGVGPESLAIVAVRADDDGRPAAAGERPRGEGRRGPGSERADRGGRARDLRQRLRQLPDHARGVRGPVLRGRGDLVRPRRAGGLPRRGRRDGRGPRAAGLRRAAELRPCPRPAPARGRA